MKNCEENKGNNCGEPCYTPTTCGGVVSSFTFPTSTSTPPTAPENYPATAVSFNFEDNLCALASNSNDDCSTITTIDDALNLINRYFCSFPKTLDERLNDSILIYNLEDQQWVKEKLIDSVIRVIGNFLKPGQFLLGTPSGVLPLFLCEQVYDCLLKLFCKDNDVITMRNGQITTVSIDKIVERFLDDLFKADGDFLIQENGDIYSRNFKNYVKDSLRLQPNNFWYGGSQGGLFEVNFPAQVFGSLNDKVSKPGEFFLTGCDGNLTVAMFCEEVINCLNPLLGRNEIFFGSGLTPTPLCGAIIEADCLPPGTFWFNDGCGTGIYNFCEEVRDCLDLFLNNNEILMGSPNGEVVAINICEALVTAGCFEGNAGDIYINDGSNIPVSSGFLDYLNTYIDPPLPPACPNQLIGLLFDPSTETWSFDEVIRDRPTAQEIAAYSPPTARTDKAKMYIEWSENGQCSEWRSSPRQRNFSILIPTDFPDLQSAVDWLQATTIDEIAIDITSDQPAVVLEGFNGRLVLNFNGNTSGGIAVTSPTADVYIENATVTGGVTATNGATVRVFNVTATGHFGDGFAANRHSRMIFLSNVTSSGNGLSGFRARNGSYLHFLFDAVSDGNTTGFLADGDAGMKAVDGGNLTARNNSVNGFVATEAGNIITDEGNLVSENNGRSGYEVANNGFLKGVNIIAQNNVQVGLRSRSGGNVTAVNDIQTTSNGLEGLLVEEGGIVQADNNIISTNNGAANVSVQSGNLDAQVNLTSTGSGAQGLFITNSGSVNVDGVLTVTGSTGNGVVVNIGSSLSVGSFTDIQNSGNNGLLVALASTAILNGGFTISNNTGNGSQVFDQSTLVAFNGAVNANGGDYGIEVANGSSVTFYGSNVTGNTLDILSRELSMARLVQAPFNSTVGTTNPPTLSTAGNLGAYII